MKIVSWNINGLRASGRLDNLDDLIKTHNPDIICLSETKLSYPYQNSINNINNRYSQYPYKSYAVSWIKNGYSGVSIWSKIKPIKFTEGINNDKLDTEGRVITAYFDDLILVNIYS